MGLRSYYDNFVQRESSNEKKNENCAIPRMERFTPRTESFIPRLQTFIPRLERFTPRLESFIPRTESFIPRTESFIPRLERFIPRTERFIYKQYYLIPNLKRISTLLYIRIRVYSFEIVLSGLKSYNTKIKLKII